MIVVADGWKRCGGQCRRFMRHQDYYRWLDSRNGRSRTSRLCKRCTRERNRENYRRRMADPYTANAERKRAREYKRNRPDPGNAVRCQDYRERLRAIAPELYGQQLADTRIRSRLARGVSEPPNSTRATVAAYTPPSRAETVSTAPLRAYLERYFHGWTEREMCARVNRGLPGAGARRVFEQERIALDFADRLLVLGLGRPDLLNALYPVGPR